MKSSGLCQERDNKEKEISSLLMVTLYYWSLQHVNARNNNGSFKCQQKQKRFQHFRQLSPSLR